MAVLVGREKCYLRRFDYTDNCKTCSGFENKLCYQTKFDVQEHLAFFNSLFIQKLENSNDDVGRLEDFDEMFEIHSGGFI